MLRSESKFCQQVIQSQESNVTEPDLVNGKTFLTFLATNSISLGNKLSESKASLSINEPPDVVCVVETWFSETSDTSLGGYVLYRRDRGHLKG